MLRHPWIWVLAVGVVGAVIVSLSVALDSERSLSDFLYDAGIGVLIATALGVLASHFVQRQERLQQQERDRMKTAREHLERVGNLISASMADVDATMNALNVEEKLHELDMKLHALHDDVMRIRDRTDPSYEHPNVEIFNRMKAAPKGHSAAEERGTTSGGAAAE
jgi:hypothetical protein